MNRARVTERAIHIGGAVLLTVLTRAALAQAKPDRRDLQAQSIAEKCNAGEIWERLIEAKGGRENLARIESLLVKGDEFYWRGLSRDHLTARMLFRFPDFTWSWFDYGNSIFPVSVTQSYADTGIRIRDEGVGLNKDKSDYHPWQQVPVLLLETRWMRPVLESCSSSEGTTTLTVRFSQIPYPFVYYVAGQSWRPHKVEIVEPTAKDVYTLSDYRIVDRIMMPTRMISRYGILPALNLRLAYEINPDYDPALPNKDPSVASGPDAWRRPKKPQ